MTEEENKQFERDFEKWFGEPWKVGHIRRIKLYLIGMVIGLGLILISTLM
ncbi:MAG: hypothetical protein WC428_02645 [Candidatus Paceibacterota bacterium]